jgi:HEAT repeat protein
MHIETPGQTLPAFAIALRAADVRTQNEGVAAAIGLGAAAVPALLELLGEPGVARGQVAFTLAEIADGRARSAFVAGLSDADEQVRAQSARGLSRLGDPAALGACLGALNDDPDPLHLDRTPAVEALGAMGLAAVPGLLDLMAADDEMTRLRAQRALELVLGRRHGFQPGAGFPTPQAVAAMRAEWLANGDYDYAALEERRRAALDCWQRWLKTAQEQP